MRTCEFCKSEAPDTAIFCGQCGQRLNAPGETSTGNSITLGSFWPIMSDTGGGIGENAPFTTANSAQKKETASAHDIPIPGEDEDEEKSTFVPFMPMPASGSVQPGGSVPLVQGTLHADHVPY